MANSPDVTRWLGIFEEGDALRNVSNHIRVNRLSRILGGIQGMGIRFEKPLNGEGAGWLAILDGSTDVPYPEDSDGNTFITIDRRFAIDTGDTSGTATQKIYGKTASQADSFALAVEWDVTAAAGSDFSKARFHIPVAVADTATVITHVLGRDSDGAVYWVSTTDTCTA